MTVRVWLSDFEMFSLVSDEYATLVPGKPIEIHEGDKIDVALHKYDKYAKTIFLGEVASVTFTACGTQIIQAVVTSEPSCGG